VSCPTDLRIGFELFSYSVVFATKSDSLKVLPIDEHQHNRYLPPAALTLVVVQPVAAPLALVRVAPARGKRGIVEAVPHVSKIMIESKLEKS
jgi:hypothetical protein